MNKSLIVIQNATVRFRDQLIFEELDFNWKHGQHWGIVGQSGEEQTAFLNTLLGKTNLVKGKIIRPFAEAYQNEMSQKGQVNSFRDLIAVVSQKYIFRNKSNLRNFYYQQRFNSMESDEAATVLEYLDEQDSFQTEVKDAGFWNKESVIQLMRLEELKNKSLIKLSNGETRRLAIAAALIKNPKLLLLDQPMTGLDLETRRDFGKMLDLIVESGIHIVMATNKNEIPGCISDIGVLERKKIRSIYNLQNDNLQFPEAKAFEEFNKDLLGELVSEKQEILFEKIVELRDVSISYDQKAILKGINWTVLPKEKWALKGPNGAGKSTLLSLIQGENPQAYANDIVLFDRKRGTGESIWDIKKHVGFVAPELSRFFPANQTCLKVVLSGLFDTIGLFKKVNLQQELLAHKWLSLFNLEDFATLRLNRISQDHQRFVLLARAMIKLPALLILDEAAQGLDEQQRIVFKTAIDHISASYPVSIIYVSHYEEDIPDCVDKMLRLENGRVVETIRR